MPNLTDDQNVDKFIENSHSRGKPQKEVDWPKLESMLAMHMTQMDVCLEFNMTSDTLSKKVKEKTGLVYSEYASTFKQRGKRMLRQLQWQVAKEKNTTMLMHLGKTYLDDQKPESAKLEVHNHISIGEEKELLNEVMAELNLLKDDTTPQEDL